VTAEADPTCRCGHPRSAHTDRCQACVADGLAILNNHEFIGRDEAPEPAQAAGAPSNRVWLTRATPSEAWQPLDLNAPVRELLDGHSLDTIRAIFGLLGRDLLLKVQAPAHDGPSVAECAAADRRWPLEKEGS
jgi:hypothetical protein